MTPRRPRRDPVVLADGTVLDDATAERIVAEVEQAAADGRGTVALPRKGRPPLTGRTGPSPHVGFRVSPELRRAAADRARREGRTVSALARAALEEYLHRAG